MKMLLLLFALILSANTFAQDDEDLDSVRPFYFMDSIYLKYYLINNKLDRKIYYDDSEIADMLYDSTEIRIASDEDLSMLLSDSIAREYHASKKFNSHRQIKTIYGFIDRTAVDSTLNVLYVRVISTCQPCMNSIIDNIKGEEQITKFLSSHRLKYVYVNYFQTTRYSRYEYIVITAKHWFRREETYTLYNEKP